MAEYVVTWESDIDAESPVEAAEEALAAITRTGSIAHVFTVAPKAAGERAVTVDLNYPAPTEDDATTDEVENLADLRLDRNRKEIR